MVDLERTIWRFCKPALGDYNMPLALGANLEVSACTVNRLLCSGTENKRGLRPGAQEAGSPQTAVQQGEEVSCAPRKTQHNSSG